MKGFTPTIFVASVDCDGIKKGIADYYCDGVADEVQINLALADAAAMGGAFVLLSAGNFYLADTIYIGNNTILSGLGPSTKLQFAVTVGDKIMITNNCGWTFEARHATGNWNITVRDMQIDGDKDHRGVGSDVINTVHFNTTKNLLIEHLVVNNGWTGAIRTEFCTYVTIANNRIDNPGDDNIEINEETFFCNCYGNHCTNAGLGKSYGSPNGIEVQDSAHDISVHDNTIEIAAHAGIEVSCHGIHTGCYNVSIIGNSIFNCPWGIYLLGVTTDYQKYITVSHNKIYHDIAVSNYQIYAKWVQDTMISDNIVRTKYHGGILSTANNRINIHSNAFQCLDAAGNDKTGFWFDGTETDIRFSGNIVRNFGYRGLTITGTISDMHVVDNHIIECSRATGACIRWESPTSLRCRFDRNYLDGKHWSYDAATSTYDVLAANWTEAWNEKYVH